MSGYLSRVKAAENNMVSGSVSSLERWLSVLVCFFFLNKKQMFKATEISEPC